MLNYTTSFASFGAYMNNVKHTRGDCYMYALPVCNMWLKNENNSKKVMPKL